MESEPSSAEDCQSLHDPKTLEVINSWLSMEQYVQQRKAMYPRINEQAGPMALVVNLTHIPVTSVSETLKKSPDEAKNHPGVRVNFFISKIIYPGWSSVASTKGMDAKDLGSSSANAKQKGKRGGTTEIKEKLSEMFGEHVIMHSFDLVNQRGTYIRNGKSDECIVLSPGMLITSKIWGNKFDKTFKDQASDIQIFDVALIQFGMHSISSSAKENGMMLEIKQFNSIPNLKISAFNILSSKLLASNMQEFSMMRAKFTDGSHITPRYENKENEDSTVVCPIKGLTQEMLRGNMSTSCFLIKAIPTQANGIFAIGPDDTVRFFLNQPLADIPSSGNLTVHWDPNDFLYNSHMVQKKIPSFETTLQYKEWVVKLFNVFQLIGAVELITIVDTYKKNKAQQEDSADASDLILDTYARINVSIITEKMIASKSRPAASYPFIANAMTKQGLGAHLRFLVVFAIPIINSPGMQIHVAIDLRKISKKQSEPTDPCPTPTYSGTLVMPDSYWEKGHNAYVFMEEKLVLYMLIPISGSAMGAETTRLVLESINIAAMVESDGIEYDETDFHAESAPTMEEPKSADASEQARVKRPKKTS